MEARNYYDESWEKSEMEGKKGYTVADILALPDGERAELLDGEMFLMATPNDTHQGILGWMHLEIANYIRSKKTEYIERLAPYAVFLMNDDKNYVEPDVLVMCDGDKRQKDGCHGAPDWAVEIVSPSSRTMDYKRKVAAYEKAGVREYWIIDPEKQVVIVYHWQKGDAPEMYRFTDTVPSGIVEGLSIDFSRMMEEI